MRPFCFRHETGRWNFVWNPWKFRDETHENPSWNIEIGSLKFRHSGFRQRPFRHERPALPSWNPPLRPHPFPSWDPSFRLETNPCNILIFFMRPLRIRHENLNQIPGNSVMKLFRFPSWDRPVTIWLKSLRSFHFLHETLPFPSWDRPLKFRLEPSNGTPRSDPTMSVHSDCVREPWISWWNHSIFVMGSLHFRNETTSLSSHHFRRETPFPSRDRPLKFRHETPQNPSWDPQSDPSNEVVRPFRFRHETLPFPSWNRPLKVQLNPPEIVYHFRHETLLFPSWDRPLKFCLKPLEIPWWNSWEPVVKHWN